MKIEIIADGHNALRTKQVSAKHRVSSFCKRNQKGSPLINNIYIYKLCILLLFLFSPKGGYGNYGNFPAGFWEECRRFFTLHK